MLTRFAARVRRASVLATGCLVALVIVLGVDAADPLKAAKTPLDEYVAKPDATYSWKIVQTIPEEMQTTYILDMKSQSWRSVPEVDRTVWQHWLVIVKPKTVKYDTAFLTVGGGNNKSAAPDKANPQSIRMANATNSVVAELRMIPNQPLVFNGDGKPRSEDDLIAYCWVKYMESRDPTWLPRLPMVKSVVRAMDAVTECLASEEGGRTPVKKFVVAGGSKRGWTTWLTGAVDPRVTAIVPIVIDVVNVRACSINHWCSYGFWAPAIGDYTRHGIKDHMDDPAYAELLRIVDPYFYRDRLTLPKFVVNAGGDQYFPPDSSKFYFGELPGTKYLRYVPNADHSLRGSDASDSILAFYRAILNKSELPKFTWKMMPGGAIEVQTQAKPLEVNLWQATNPKARDFRLVTIGQAYTKAPLERTSAGAYVAQVPKPATGWTAFLVELVFDSGAQEPYKFTTEVSIVPEVLPYRIEDLKKGGK